MSERLSSAAAYYEQQQQQQSRQTQMLLTSGMHAHDTSSPLHYAPYGHAPPNARLAYAERSGGGYYGGMPATNNYAYAGGAHSAYGSAAYGGGSAAYLGHYYARNAYESAAQYAAARARYANASYAHTHSYSAQQQHPNSHLHQQHMTPHMNASSMHHGMFTPAGQQLVPSSVLHYPPRSTPYAHAQTLPSSYEQTMPYTRTNFAHTAYNSGGNGSYAATNPAAHIPTHYQPTTQRASTPAPNRTVVPHYLEPLRNYHESLARRCSESNLSLPNAAAAVTDVLSSAQLPMKSQEMLCESSADLSASSPPRLTTSPPMISATGTDSGISNCSTRARSDSSQSTPIYSSDYPVNMSVESASCVSYHCEEKEREATNEDEGDTANELKVQMPADEESVTTTTNAHKSDDISNAASTLSKQQSNTPQTQLPPTQAQSQSQSQSEPQTHSVVAAEESEAGNSIGNGIDDIKREINLDVSARLAQQQQQPKAITAASSLTTAEEQSQKREDIPVAVDRSRSTSSSQHSRNDNSIEREFTTVNPNTSTSVATPDKPETPLSGHQHANGNWSTYPCSPATISNQQRHSPSLSSPVTTTTGGAGSGAEQRRQQQRTPPVPHNSPVGYGCSPIVPIAPTPMRAKPPHNATTNKQKQITTNKNRIMECDLIPSKKSKRHDELREEIRDIKPLPAFQQAFGSTEIGRFAETFPLTTEQQPLLERTMSTCDDYSYACGKPQTQDAYAGGYYENSAYLGGYDSSISSNNNNSSSSSSNYSYNNNSSGNSWQHYEAAANDYARRSAMGMRDIMAYERYLQASRSRQAHYGEIRCNGF